MAKLLMNVLVLTALPVCKNSKHFHKKSLMVYQSRFTAQFVTKLQKKSLKVQSYKGGGEGDKRTKVAVFYKTHLFRFRF